MALGINIGSGSFVSRAQHEHQVHTAKFNKIHTVSGSTFNYFATGSAKGSKGFIVETAGDADVYFQGGGKLDIGSVTAKELYEIGVQQVSGSNSVVHVVY
tara:strand:- start:65 stop:364 length:300 start_codon:yes stop_codon:yes gene_type:complete